MSEMDIFCPVCNGSGNENRTGYVRCSLCNGTGTIDSDMMDELTAGIPMEERG
jgi:DnaJ-class molecular chaperone